MDRTELELLAALYILYFSECAHWVDASEVALTRAYGTDWKEWRVSAQSFTLLGRVLVTPSVFLIRPGLIRRARALHENIGQEALRRISEALDELYFLRLQCQFQALLLLVVLPIILYLRLLSPMWPYFTGVLLVSHFLLIVSFLRVLRKRNLPAPYRITGPAIVNPLGATRALDHIAQLIFENQTMTSIQPASSTITES